MRSASCFNNHELRKILAEPAFDATLFPVLRSPREPRARDHGSLLRLDASRVDRVGGRSCRRDRASRGRPGRADRARRRPHRLVAGAGIALSPFTAHAAFGEWKRAAAFSAIPVATEIAISISLMARPGAVYHGTKITRTTFAILFPADVFIAALGLVDASFAGDRKRERSERRAHAPLRLPHRRRRRPRLHPRRHAVKRSFALPLALILGGCVVVPQNRRARLADPMMSLAADPLEAHRKQKLYRARARGWRRFARRSVVSQGTTPPHREPTIGFQFSSNRQNILARLRPWGAPRPRRGWRARVFTACGAAWIEPCQSEFHAHDDPERADVPARPRRASPPWSLPRSSSTPP